ncbi:hypothetical protein CHU_0625 [Cytophaga hutchinsonii ATCC 33406]|uniref:Uncharacterized protein n=1 Tax=Cytophaga hutchinsonii (strain ATCC 33406 / DSM 1761 / CIP 103989 / NBRC 15051 / NCIMB 9469 / D465) TaxID=269798 RepID=A0A6N4SNR6_CYTH3|nr:hypothetical protein CHU_0625 [Cytophaga hutchinsonii ATCC 33406]
MLLLRHCNLFFCLNFQSAKNPPRRRTETAVYLYANADQLYFLVLLFRSGDK